MRRSVIWLLTKIYLDDKEKISKLTVRNAPATHLISLITDMDNGNAGSNSKAAEEYRQNDIAGQKRQEDTLADDSSESPSEYGMANLMHNLLGNTTEANVENLQNF